MPRPVSNLESHLGYWVRFVSNHVSHAFRLKVEAHGVTVAEWVIMRALLDAGEIHPSRLADAVGLTRGAVSKLIDRLAAKGHVYCRAERADRRYQLVSLSPHGQNLVPVLAALADQNDHEFFGDLTPDDRSTLFSLMKHIVERHGLKNIPTD